MTNVSPTMCRRGSDCRLEKSMTWDLRSQQETNGANKVPAGLWPAGTVEGGSLPTPRLGPGRSRARRGILEELVRRPEQEGPTQGIGEARVISALERCVLHGLRRIGIQQVVDARRQRQVLDARPRH